MARKSRSVWVPPGIIAVHKPVGVTSHDVVDYVRRLLPRRAKVGHTGTLDPFAEGVLPLCVGGMTRLADRIGGLPKVYRGLADLSTDTDSGDLTGEVVETFSPDVNPSGRVVENVLTDFVGEIEQIPPALSAIRVNGVRAYTRVRRGEVVEMPARKVTLYSLELLEYQWPWLDFRVCCSRGTYVRSLARDLGRALGVGGHLRKLVREAVGSLTLEQAQTPFELLQQASLRESFAPLNLCLPEIRQAEVEQGATGDLLQGRSISPEKLKGFTEPPSEGEEFFLFRPGVRTPLALAICRGDGYLHPVRVMGRKD
jgi:tRNA pseudouridine55 synthase